MLKNDLITKTMDLLADFFKDSTNLLEEPAEKMRIQVIQTGKSVVYSFDIAQKKDYRTKIYSLSLRHSKVRIRCVII